MAAQSLLGDRPLRHSRLLFRTAAAAALLTTACDPVAQTRSQTPARAQEPTTVTHRGASALMDAERVDACFAAIPTAVDDIPATSVRGDAAQVAALRRAAEQAYHNEASGLRDKLFADLKVPSDAADVIRSLTLLAKARDAAAGRPWTMERSKALDSALAAHPDRQGIIALSATMAAPRCADERALTARLMAWGLDQARRNGPGTSPFDVSEQVADIMDATRMAEDAKMRAGAGATRRDHALIEALLAMPGPDIATLTRWYGSDAGKAAKDQVVGYLQGASDRAGRAMLINFLTNAEVGG